MKLGFIRLYAPEQWGSLEKFNKFYSGTFSLNESGKRSVSGAINHFKKGLVLRDLALKLSPNLAVDENELNQQGYTYAINSRELSAIIEGAILEFYSSIDCTSKVITEIYKNHQGIPNSTRKFFQNVRSGKVDKDFPEELRIAVNEATFYEGFRRIRDELTHLDIGRCHKDKDTGKIRYIHDSFSLKIDDIFQKLEQTAIDVNQFIGRVFAYLFSQLKDERITQICGIFDSHVYTRHVSPSEAIDFHGGVCESRKWFDLEEKLACVFADNCGAYKNYVD